MEIRQKHLKWLAISIVIVLVALAIYLCWWVFSRPLDTCIQVEYLQTAAGDSADIYRFDTWQTTSQKPAGEPILTWEPQELLILEFYENGTVKVSNGYAQIGTKSAVCYDIPQDVLEAILDCHNELPKP